MSMKPIWYIDNEKNKIDIATTEGIGTAITDIFEECNREDSCLCVRENLKNLIDRIYKERVIEIKQEI